MLSAAARLDGVVVTGVLERAAQAHAEKLGLDLANVRETPFAPEALTSLVRRQDCNLYVSLSECSPLFPLESLHQGVPCLIGPTSHLFTRSPLEGEGGSPAEPSAREAAALLEERLVVGRPDDPDSIARSVTRAVADRAGIIEAYCDWVGSYERAARSSIRAFLANSDQGGATP